MFTGPANKACASDAECPGAVAGSCSAAKKCTTNCAAKVGAVSMPAPQTAKPGAYAESP